MVHARRVGSYPIRALNDCSVETEEAAIATRLHKVKLGSNARKREQVRCSSLVDRPVYPRLARTMRVPTRTRNPGIANRLLRACAAPVRATAT